MSHFRFAILVALAAALPAAAQKGPLATGDVNQADVVAEVTECRRVDNQMSLRIRLKNTGTEDRAFYIVDSNRYDDHYVTAGKKKYLMLRDANKKPLAPEGDAMGNVYVNLKKGGVWHWHAKFPAPPADVKTVEYNWPIGSPISDISCGTGS